MHPLTRCGCVIGAVLLLALVLPGCKKHHDPATESEHNPLHQDPAGGAPARNDVQRGAQLRVNENLMKQIGLFYQFYRNDHDGQPPRTEAEFKAYLQSDPNARNEVEAFNKGWIVLVLDPPPNSHQVLAYEKEPYQNWGNRIVLLGDGSVKVMVEAEFQAALKAQ
jgi:hypothetical protein